MVKRRLLSLACLEHSSDTVELRGLEINDSVQHYLVELTVEFGHMDILG